MASARNGWSQRLRKVRGSTNSTQTASVQPPSQAEVVTVDLCTTLEEESSCIDLTCEVDEDFVDLTAVNDISVMVLGSGRSDGHGGCRKRKHSRTQSTETNENDDCELPDICLSNQVPVPSSSKNCKTSLRPCTSMVKGVFCPVCLDDYDSIRRTSRQLVSTICGHIFCDVCIKETIRTQHCCPTCRSKLTLKKFHPIFI